MKRQIKIQAIWLLALLLSIISIDVQAQLAAGQSKFLGNTHTKGQTPLNFDHYWNQLTPGNAGKWASCEQARDDFNYWLWLDRAYDHAREFGLTFKEHTLIWGSSSGEPSWMSSVPQDEQMDEVLEWYQALSERYPDLELIDVVNEPLHAPPSFTEALGGTGETGWDWVVWCFERAREYFPNATLILNEYNVLNYTSTCQDYLEIVNILNDRGLIDAIGCQAHSLETIDIETIKTNLDLLAATGLDIYISEYEARGDDATQLALFQEQFPVFWEHPSVKGVTLWGYLEGDMWRSEAYLLAADGVTERPALQWLKEYFNFTDNTPGPYTMILDTTGVGTVTLSPSGGQYDAGTEVIATATPGEGYVFSHWTGDLAGSTNPNTIAMTSNRSLTANFVPEGYIQTYTLDVTVSGNGSVTQSPEGGVFAEGAVVTLIAVPDEDYMFTGWSGTVNSSSTTIEVTMESNTVLTASFAKTPGTGCEGEESISMNFEQNGVGEFCYAAQGELNYINSWNMDYLEVNGQDFTNIWTNSVPASADGLIHIHYVSTVSWSHFEIKGTDGEPITSYTLTINTTGSGSVDPNGGTYSEGSDVTLIATPASGYEFDSWSGDVSGTTNPITVTMDADKSVTANFTEITPVYYDLATNVVGQGTISQVDGTYEEGTEISITATPTAGWSFESWSGDVSGSSATITFTMNSDISVTATFTQEPTVTYDLTVNVQGAGSVDPDGGIFAEGTQVIITATPNEGNTFIGWSGDASGTENPITITMDSDKSISASFVVIENPCIGSAENISLPFSYNGTGDLCWFTTNGISYVNSWNMTVVEINGVDYTNTWSSSMPEPIDGGYYIYYQGNYSWSHFEAAGPKSAGSLGADNSVMVYPNPFSESTSLIIDHPESVTNIEIVDYTGRVVETYFKTDIQNQMQIGSELNSGMYFIRANSSEGIQTIILNKQ